MSELDEFRRLRHDAMWDQGETNNMYGFPLPLNPHFFLAGRKLARGISQEQLYRVGPFLAARSPNSHVGPYKWAIDFLVPDGTHVLAAEAGRIIGAEDGFNVWGVGEEFANMANHVMLQHENGEYSQYIHLAQHSLRSRRLSVGDAVQKGQVIAEVGKTGWTDRDHLHFVVYAKGVLPRSSCGFYSLKVRFEK